MTKKNKTQILIPIFILVINWVHAQINHRYFFDTGLTLQQTKEMRFTSNFREGLGVNTSMGYEKQTDKSINRFSILFTYAKQGQENISFSHNLRPETKYEHLRHINEKVAIGGYFDVGTLLSLRVGKKTSENSISYCIWSSLGFSTQVSKVVNVFGKVFTWKNTFSLPIVSYVVRPSYAFPYPENFLEEGTFNFALSGLGKKIVTGGKIKGLPSFTNIHLQTGLNYVTNNKKWAYGINYSLGYLQTKELKSIFQFNHQVNLVIEKLRTK